MILEEEKENFLVENSLYSSEEELQDLLKNPQKIANSFFLNFLGTLGLYKISDKRNIIKTYFKDDEKLDLKSVGEANKDISLVVKLYKEVGGLTSATANKILRLLNKIKNRAITSKNLDEELIREIIKETKYQTVRPHILIFHVLKGYEEGVVSLRQLSKYFYNLVKIRKKEFLPVSNEFFDLARLYKVYFNSIPEIGVFDYGDDNDSADLGNGNDFSSKQQSNQQNNVEKERQQTSTTTTDDDFSSSKQKNEKQLLEKLWKATSSKSFFDVLSKQDENYADISSKMIDYVTGTIDGKKILDGVNYATFRKVQRKFFIDYGNEKAEKFVIKFSFFKILKEKNVDKMNSYLVDLKEYYGLEKIKNLFKNETNLFSELFGKDIYHKLAEKFITLLQQYVSSSKPNELEIANDLYTEVEKTVKNFWNFDYLIDEIQPENENLSDEQKIKFFLFFLGREKGEDFSFLAFNDLKDLLDSNSYEYEIEDLGKEKIFVFSKESNFYKKYKDYIDFWVLKGSNGYIRVKDKDDFDTFYEEIFKNLGFKESLDSIFERKANLIMKKENNDLSKAKENVISYLENRVSKEILYSEIIRSVDFLNPFNNLQKEIYTYFMEKMLTEVKNGEIELFENSKKINIIFHFKNVFENKFLSYFTKYNDLYEEFLKELLQRSKKIQKDLFSNVLTNTYSDIDPYVLLQYLDCKTIVENIFELEDEKRKSIDIAKILMDEKISSCIDTEEKEVEVYEKFGFFVYASVLKNKNKEIDYELFTKESIVSDVVNYLREMPEGSKLPEILKDILDGEKSQELIGEIFDRYIDTYQILPFLDDILLDFDEKYTKKFISNLSPKLLVDILRGYEDPFSLSFYSYKKDDPRYEEGNLIALNTELIFSSLDAKNRKKLFKEIKDTGFLYEHGGLRFFDNVSYLITNNLSKFDKSDIKFLLTELGKAIISKVNISNVSESAETSMRFIIPLLKNGNYNTEINDFLGKIEKNQKEKIVEKLVNYFALSDALNEIQSDKNVIKPLIELDEERVKTILEYNNVNLIEQVEYEEKDTIEQIIEKNRRRSVEKIKGLNVNKLSKTEDELLRMSVEYDALNKYKHGKIAVQILDVFNVSIPEQEVGFKNWLLKMKREKIDPGLMKPVFHGTGSVGASMILRYGFRVIEERDEAVVGRMLGDGIYFSNVLDKVAQYIGDSGYSRELGTEGYILEMEASLGKKGRDYNSAGVEDSYTISPEWVVYNPNEQLRIYRALKVKLIDKAEMDMLKRKYLKEDEDDDIMRIMTFKEFLHEELNGMPKHCVTFIFMDGTIPINRKGDVVDFEKFDASKFGKNVKLDYTGSGPAVRIYNNKESAVFLIRFTRRMVSDKTKLFEKYLDLLGL